MATLADRPRMMKRAERTRAEEPLTEVVQRALAEPHALSTARQQVVRSTLAAARQRVEHPEAVEQVLRASAAVAHRALQVAAAGTTMQV